VEVVIVDDHQAGANIIADAIVDLVVAKPTAVLGLATGSSPLPVYDRLIDDVRDRGLDFSAVTAFTLDEYVGLEPDHPEAYRSFIRRRFTLEAGIEDSRLHSPSVRDQDVAHGCAEYEATMRSVGGVDLQLLGIGSDGHIAFNEPTSSLGSRTRMKTLLEQTRVDNARFFDNDIDQVPMHVITQGIGTILEAQHLTLIAAGESKARAVAAAIEGPLSAMVPASALQLHPHATVVLDHAAASELALTEYYRTTFARKPSWQSI